MNALFKQWGNSLAVRIPSGLARELNVFDGKAADIQVREKSLVVTPIDDNPSYDINALVSLITPENIHAEIDSGDVVGNEGW